MPQVTQLAANPATTIATPSRCGKSLREKSSSLGQTSQRRSLTRPAPGGAERPAAVRHSIAPAGTASTAPQAEQGRLAAVSAPSWVTVVAQAGQA